MTGRSAQEGQWVDIYGAFQTPEADMSEAAGAFAAQSKASVRVVARSDAMEDHRKNLAIPSRWAHGTIAHITMPATTLINML